MQNFGSFVSQSHRSIQIVPPNTPASFLHLSVATLRGGGHTKKKILVVALILATMDRYKIIYEDNGTIYFVYQKLILIKPEAAVKF